MKNNDELIDNFDYDTSIGKEPKVNYLKYTIIYCILMPFIGYLLTKLNSSLELELQDLLLGSFTFIGIAVALALVYELLIKQFFGRLESKQTGEPTPFWFSLLESTFNIWCAIILVTLFAKYFL